MTIAAPFHNVAKPARKTRRSIASLLAPLEKIAANSPNLVANHDAKFEVAGESYELPRYLFVGPRGGDTPIRVGIFAGIHGDEPEGVHAIVQFIQLLEAHPELATGYYLSFYPVCNPTGFEDNTRHSRRGKDLNREFWKDSDEPEVRWLEKEIWAHAFDGIVTLHSDDTSDGLYGFVGGAVLSENLLEPALREAEKFLPRNRRRVIDGFAARSGIITDGYHGVLKSLPGVHRPPFEITFETPQKTSLHRQVESITAALQTILVEYRYLQAIAQNI